MVGIQRHCRVPCELRDVSARTVFRVVSDCEGNKVSRHPCENLLIRVCEIVHFHDGFRAKLHEEPHRIWKGDFLQGSDELMSMMAVSDGPDDMVCPGAH